MSAFIEILIFAALAVFVLYKLGSILGRKDFEPDEKIKEKHAEILRFPKAEEQERVEKIEVEPVIDVEMEKLEDQKLKQQVQEIKSKSKDFSLTDFISGAKKAFEMIVEGYAKGEKQNLQPLLSDKIYKSFEKAIDDRNKKQQTMQVTLISFENVLLKDAKLKNNIASIVINFVSEQIEVLFDKSGKVIEGSPSMVDKVSDIWTFEKNIKDKNPNWKLVKTEEG